MVPHAGPASSCSTDRSIGSIGSPAYELSVGRGDAPLYDVRALRQLPEVCHQEPSVVRAHSRVVLVHPLTLLIVDLKGFEFGLDGLVEQELHLHGRLGQGACVGGVCLHQPGVGQGGATRQEQPGGRQPEKGRQPPRTWLRLHYLLLRSSATSAKIRARTPTPRPP
jgi:hypothetical protein